MIKSYVGFGIRIPNHLVITLCRKMKTKQAASRISVINQYTNSYSIHSIHSHAISVKLDNNNFLLFGISRFSLQSLVINQLKQFINPNSVVPPKFLSSSGKINEKHVDWLGNDKLLSSWILSSIYESVLSSFWSRIINHFASQTRVKEM